MRGFRPLAAAVLTVLTVRSCAAGPVEERMAKVVDAFYDLRFDEAEAAARALETEFPGHPGGPFYRSMVEYQRFLVEDPPSTSTLAGFETLNAAAIASAEASTSPALSHYYLGAAHGFAARVLLARDHRGAAIARARVAARHMREAAKLAPEDDDVYLGLGMYDYFLSRIPIAAKPLAYMMVGMWGDRERGLAELRRAAEGKGAARMEARAVLAAVLGSRHEKAWDEAEKLLAELIERYPRNPLYRLRLVHVLLSRGDLDRAAKTADPDGPWLAAVAPVVRERAREEARRRAGEAVELKAGRLEKPEKFRWPLPAMPER